MSITANHLIADIRGIASSGGNPNEFKVSDEQILYWVEEVRAMLISQKLNKKDDINDSWIQYINCIELEQVEDTFCCLASSDCMLLRSIKQIPSTIDTWKDNMIMYVTTVGGESINRSNPVRQRYNKYNKYTSTNRVWFLRDDYIYIINDQVLQYISLAGLFETPSDLSEFVACDGEVCFTLDSPYPISLNMASEVTDIIIKTKINPFFAFPMDNKNDASGVTPQQSIQNKQAD